MTTGKYVVFLGGTAATACCISNIVTTVRHQPLWPPERVAFLVVYSSVACMLFGLLVMRVGQYLKAREEDEEAKSLSGNAIPPRSYDGPNLKIKGPLAASSAGSSRTGTPREEEKV